MNYVHLLLLIDIAIIKNIDLCISHIKFIYIILNTTYIYIYITLYLFDQTYILM